MGAPGVIGLLAFTVLLQFGLYWLSLDGCSWSNWFILLSLDGCSWSNWFILAFTGWVLGVIGLYWLSLDGCSWSNWFILAFTGWVLLK